jgi:nucleoside phosphorylase
LATIKNLFSVFPRPLIDRVLDEALGDRILVDHIDCLIDAEAYFGSTLFHLYDGELRQLLADFFHNWNEAWEVGRSSHHPQGDGRIAILILCDTDAWERWEKHKAYLEHVAKARTAMAGLTKHLHEVYSDFDIDESDREASRKYRELEERVEKRAAELWGEAEPDQPEPDKGEGMSKEATREFLMKVGALKGMLNDRARGGQPPEKDYATLRSELVGIGVIRDALPNFVLTCHTVQEFWLFIRAKFPTYNERTEFLRQEFAPILMWLEGGVAPAAPNPAAPPAPKPDVVIVTVNEHETRAVLDAFEAATGTEAAPVPLEDRVYHDLGTMNGTRVFHAISEMGSGGAGGMQQTVEKAIRLLDPGSVIAVGIAFGVDEKKQAIGDILLSKQLRLYDLQRVGKNKIVLRGAKPDASTRLTSHFVGFAHTKWKGATFKAGVMLTGEKLIDNVDYRKQLQAFESEAIGGEMEGAGLYVSGSDQKVDWIVLKAICDFADGNKGTDKEARQKLAAGNAARFLVEALKYAPLKRR